jgi:hypothetical protein
MPFNVFSCAKNASDHRPSLRRIEIDSMPPPIFRKDS